MTKMTVRCLTSPRSGQHKRVLDLEVAKAKQGVGELPQHIVTMYDKANSMGSGRLKALRKMALDAVEQFQERTNTG